MYRSLPSLLIWKQKRFLSIFQLKPQKTPAASPDCEKAFGFLLLLLLLHAETKALRRKIWPRAFLIYHVSNLFPLRGPKPPELIDTSTTLL